MIASCAKPFTLLAVGDRLSEECGTAVAEASLFTGEKSLGFLVDACTFNLGTGGVHISSSLVTLSGSAIASSVKASR